MIDVLVHVDDFLKFLRLCKGRAQNTIFHIPLDITVQGVLRNKLMYTRNSVGQLHYLTKETAIATLVDPGYEIVNFFYAVGSMDLPGKKIKSKLAVVPRKLFYKVDKDIAA